MCQLKKKKKKRSEAPCITPARLRGDPQVSQREERSREHVHRALSFPWKRVTWPFPGCSWSCPSATGFPGARVMQGRPSKPALTLAEARDSARASGHATRTRTRELSAEARGALRVAAAAVAVGAPVVAGGAGAAPRGRPVAGLHRHQGLACGRQRHTAAQAARLPPPATPGPRATPQQPGCAGQ